ncbi:Uncharacterised protein [uncultured Eubacterium sp.]|uniref:dATP/dGTP diphosphohydrolase domain-containing protein n=1 Tax=Brotomerdimonas butyrica TaxID=2981721 RepID=UPI0008232260|nr:dATP/dGTP diphosphohydrolase domain-containing protein [Brotomerdimonas butyrica]MCU6756419.1 DUF5664 domain-containing protein [Brotomerdimonas butyrica]SCH82918.1 Uncharacterised protein [uncultured Eubacterium sp.]
MMIQDSGNRREYESGAVRDIQEGKGRCDLMPLDVVINWLQYTELIDSRELDILSCIEQYRNGENTYLLYKALDLFACATDYATAVDVILEVSKHFEEGAKKYGEDNWKKGIPESSYIDSAVRHYLKWLRDDDDERHDRAFVWNIMCLIWTHEHITNKQGMPEMAIRCVETDCYFNDDYCFCTSHNESCNPARGKECAGYSAD